jgi:type IV protein arginine methyltransferase
MEDAGETIGIDTQSVLLAASNHDVAKLKELLKKVPASVQDPESGFTPLHAAIAACETDSDSHDATGNSVCASEGGVGDSQSAREKELDAGAETVRLLFQNGAIWNDLDANDETPGCMARRLGLDEIYGLVVDAGVRAELLLSRLEEYQLLGGDDESEDDDGEERSASAGDPNGNTAAGGAVENDEDVSCENASYLASGVAFTDTSLVDASSNGVMMDWETPIMQRHAALLLPKPGLRVLNIGHGLGIVDSFFQSHAPVSHHIVEAHPTVLARMKEQGWMEKPGVVVHSGRWLEDVLPKLVLGDENGQELVFDAIFFDTFAEEYKALKEFFSEWALQLMDSEGRFGFFNGMGGDRQVCYDVYSKVSSNDISGNLD